MYTPEDYQSLTRQSVFCLYATFHLIPTIKLIIPDGGLSCRLVLVRFRPVVVLEHVIPKSHELHVGRVNLKETDYRRPTYH